MVGVLRSPLTNFCFGIFLHNAECYSCCFRRNGDGRESPVERFSWSFSWSAQIIWA